MKKSFFLLLLMYLIRSLSSAQSTVSEVDKKTIAVLGSSVAAGWVTSFKERYDMRNGYAFRLERLLAGSGFNVVNLSVPGDDTQGVLARMDKDLSSAKADYVLIGLSLGNEGLEEDQPEKVSEKYLAGLKQIIDRCRRRGMTPVLGLCYGSDSYKKVHYACIKKTNLLLNTWDLPSINLLGGLDDGSGHFPEGRHYDLYHPGDDGHEELFLTIVPSLFAALEMGKPLPEISRDKGFISIQQGMERQPISFIPGDLMHSFTLSFQIRKEDPGPFGCIDAGEQKMALGMDEKGLVYYSTLLSGKLTHLKRINDQAWHWVSLSHRYLLGETGLYVDGQPAGCLAERIEPLQFLLGGPADFRDLIVHRGALNQDEVQVLHHGKMLQASLELYAPLREILPAADQALENRAQSLTFARAFPSDANRDRDLLADKIAEAEHARASALVVKSKEVVEIDTKIYSDYAGTYEIAPKVNIVVTQENERLFLRDPDGAKTELFPESENRFFIKFPLAELIVRFTRGKGDAVEQLVFSVDGNETPARKIN